MAGVGKGDRVAILAHDGVEHLDLFYACGKLGAIHTGLNWRLHWRELADLIENTQPKVLIYSDDFKSAVAEIQATTLKPRHVTSPTTDHRSPHAIRFYVHLDGPGIPGSLHYQSTLDQSTDLPVTCETLDTEDIACLLFTGGTTGLPGPPRSATARSAGTR